ncbi:hypothetical protein [Devosia rhizoryzae]|uniref:LPS-assembly lipoprotein n=1 Tax=Devosia rhizoryzae TaxID=2774137 RepID=A0ABX7C888_9HYPH|nr:hypothetical protein [Devosia rhizoryzae]QQR39494.1 hypothetical protein JI748_00270 [Devosia rhizoryzae]
MKHFLAPLVAGVFAITLGACTSFAPVYGDVSSTSVSAARFNLAPPKNRLEQIILNRLDIAFPGPANPSDPVLTVTAATTGLAGGLSNAIVVGNPVSTRVEATVTITQGDQVLFTTRRFTDSTYQSGKLTPTDVFSATGAQETAARSTAESLRAAILAGYRPGMTPITPAQ